MKLLLTTRLSPRSLGSVVYVRTPVASKNIDTGQWDTVKSMRQLPINTKMVLVFLTVGWLTPL